LSGALVRLVAGGGFAGNTASKRLRNFLLDEFFELLVSFAQA
jgi:hypothetical protein